MQAFFKDQYTRRLVLWLALLILLLVLLLNPAVGFGVTMQTDADRSGVVKMRGKTTAGCFILRHASTDSCPEEIGPRGA
jgi:hypothetical protein